MDSESVRRPVSWGLEEAAFVTELVVSEVAAPHMRRARVFGGEAEVSGSVAQLTQSRGTRQNSTGKTICGERARSATVGPDQPDKQQSAEAA
ncbi:hypothetical protein KUF83_03430 [Streptomyces sp. BV286]|uniref:hypothetical protein n=1 Tax=Streptomyces sp. BV286 TaxID=2849672 RepID=UPI001C2E75C7|nr:hypothetical protein [Streptomyces sp. BV286]MBV1935619.1 hypothetical protein [Streptomyces sp. BV286]